MEKNITMGIMAVLAIVLFSACGNVDEETGLKSETAVTNSLYHVNYFETLGNADQPVAAGTEKSLALWFEIDSPISATGKVWVDDLYLERMDQPGSNLITNASFEAGLWPAKNNSLCLANDTWCRGIFESDDYFVWQLDYGTYPSSSPSAVADMSKLGLGYQTHIFQLVSLNKTIPAGTALKAHAMIKIEGFVQARLGLDLRDSVIDSANPRGNIRSAVNGLIVRGPTSGWRRIDLR